MEWNGKCSLMPHSVFMIFLLPVEMLLCAAAIRSSSYFQRSIRKLADEIVSQLTESNTCRCCGESEIKKCFSSFFSSIPNVKLNIFEEVAFHLSTDTLVSIAFTRNENWWLNMVFKSICNKRITASFKLRVRNVLKFMTDSLRESPETNLEFRRLSA